MRFDYFYGEDGERFRFYMMPKALIENPLFNGLSAEAKLLYTLLLDRMQLSARNQWRDEQDHIYVIFTQEEMMEKLHCSRTKVKCVLNELDAPTGIGLIERRRQGLGKPNIIYVKDFNQPDVLKTDLQMDAFEPSDRRNPTIRRTENGLQEGRKTTAINTNNNKTDWKETDGSETPQLTGVFGNVMLTSSEQQALTKRMGDLLPGYIDRLSAHMKSTNKRYADHAATLLSWYLLDQKRAGEKGRRNRNPVPENYDEGEHL